MGYRLFCFVSILGELPEHHVQRRTVPHNHGVPPGDASSTPMAIQGLPELVQVLRVVTGFPVELARTMLNITLSIPASQQSTLSAAIGALNSGSIPNGPSLNGSLFGMHGLGNLTLPRLHPQLQSNSSSQGPPSVSLFNVTRAGNAARQAAIFSERLLLSPVFSLLALTGNPVGIGALPPSLTPAHLQRHVTHLTQFLSALRDTSTTTPAPVDTTTTIEVEIDAATVTDVPPESTTQ